MAENDPASSPCISVCRLAIDRVHCLGCLRTIDEIRAWAAMSDAERRAVLDKVAERRAEWPRADRG